MLDVALLSGPVPVLLSAAAVLGAGWLARSTRRLARSPWMLVRAITACVGFAVLEVVLLAHLARNVWLLFPDKPSIGVWSWACLGMLSINIALRVVISRRQSSSTLASVTSMVVIVAACANQINASYGAYPTARDALHIARPDDISLRDAPRHPTVGPSLYPLDTHWTPTTAGPPAGKLTSAAIPALVSGFAARNASIYLPPAYFADPQPRLPVLVLMAGQPGTPQDWLTAGRLTHILDNFAAAHRGLAPVVVVPDATGGQFGDPLCMDSALGRADSYLAIDVPNWIRSNLAVDPLPQAWAVAGASYGGTCALQLGTNHPGSYPTSLDISGAAEPSLGDHQRTVMLAFGGDEGAFC